MVPPSAWALSVTMNEPVANPGGSIPAAVIPQANPGAGYRALQPEIDRAVARVLSSGWYILGGEVRAFEAEFAAWLGAPAVVGCGNGTDAVALALRGLGIGPGAAVVTVSHTAVATVAAIEMAGATPLLGKLNSGLVAAPVPPIAGCAWQELQLFELNLGPKPLFPAALPETDSTVSNRAKPSVKKDNRLALLFTEESTAPVPRLPL